MRFAPVADRLAELGSQKWAVHLLAREMAVAGEEIIELTIGEPDFPPDPALLQECQRAMNAGRTGYSNGRGEAGLVQALASKYSRRSGREITPQNILCFPGTQTALFATLLGLVHSGDHVLVGDPLYATYEGTIRASGADMVPIPLRPEFGFRMQAADIEAVITPQSRVLLLNSPHNPTGSVLDRDDIISIGEVCRKHDLTIVSDEVYEELIFERSFASPFDEDCMADRTIVVSSISKSHAAPGFRSGWAVGPQEFCDRLLPISETMLFGGQPFIADMTAYALAKPSSVAAQMREAYQRRAELVVRSFSTSEMIKPFMPEAGMFILLDVTTSGMNGEEFAVELLKNHHVATMPGSSFGTQASNTIRLSLTVPDEKLREACARISKFVAKIG